MTQDFLFDFSSLESELLPAGEIAPDFSLPDLLEQPVRLAEVCRGRRAVLLFFWYVGCGGCRSALPQLERLYTELKSAGLEVLAVNRGDSAAAVRDYAAARPHPIPTLRAEKDGPSNPARTFGVRAFPTVYLLDADRRIVLRRVGYRDATIREALAGLLGETHPVGQ